MPTAAERFFAGVAKAAQVAATYSRTPAGLVATAMTQRGDAYVFGAEASPSNPNPSAFDCCLTGDTLVYTDRGPVRIDSLDGNEQVWSWDEGGACRRRKVVAQLDQPVQEVFKLRTRNRTIRATANHPFKVLRRTGRERVGAPVQWWTEWVRLDEVQVGDHVVILEHAPLLGIESEVEELAWLLGIYVGDGSLTSHGVNLCVFGELRDRVSAAVQNQFGTSGIEHPTHGLRINSKEFQDYVMRSGLQGLKSRTKVVPEHIKAGTPATIRAFLDGYAAADGHHGKYLSYSSASRQLVNEVRALHIMLGDGVSNVTVNQRTKPITIKGREVKDAAPLHTFEVYPGARRNQTMLDTYGARRAVPDAAFGVQQVRSIEPDGKEATYDIEVEGSHNFVADGVLVHNSELVEWSCARIGVRITDGAEAQYNACKRAGRVIPVAFAIRIPGALLFNIGPGPNRGDHVAISRGDGTTIEARGRAYGVNVFTSIGRPWTAGGLVPGLEYGASTTSGGAGGGGSFAGIGGAPSSTPPQMNGGNLLQLLSAIVETMKFRLKQGDYGSKVVLLQATLVNNGFTLAINGKYDADTKATVQRYQAKNGLRGDGIVGPMTWAKMYPALVPYLNANRAL